MHKRTPIVLVLCGLLGACAFPAAQTWTNYVLQPPPRSSRPGKTVPLSLQVATVDAPSWLNSRDMYYRLSYGSRGRVSAYSRSRWLASPPTMLSNLLVDQLSRAGLWRVVLGPGGDIFADYTLHLHLTEFQQVFRTPGQSVGVVAARASLVDQKHDLVVAQTMFRFAVAARSADAQGGAAALGKASDELAAAVEHWLQRIPPLRGPVHPGTPGGA